MILKFLKTKRPNFQISETLVLNPREDISFKVVCLDNLCVTVTMSTKRYGAKLSKSYLIHFCGPWCQDLDTSTKTMEAKPWYQDPATSTKILARKYLAWHGSSGHGTEILEGSLTGYFANEFSEIVLVKTNAENGSPTTHSGSP